MKCFFEYNQQKERIASMPENATQIEVIDENMIVVRGVHVNRSRTLQEMLKATGRKLYTNDNVVDTIPLGEGEEVDVYFFKLGCYAGAEDLEHEYELRGLKPDPRAQAKVNEDDPAFADEYPNSCFWDREDEVSSWATFKPRDVERDPGVDRGSDGWSGYWWFAGVRE